MSKLTQLKEGLYGIEVDNTQEFNLGISFNNVLYGDNNFATDFKKWSIQLPEGDFKILGTASKDKISFDIAPYVDNLFTKEAWKDYRIKEVKGYGNYPLLTPEESFYSLLNSKGYYWENPKVRPEWNDRFIDLSKRDPILIEYERQEWLWQSFEDKLLTGHILLIEKVK